MHMPDLGGCPVVTMEFVDAPHIENNRTIRSYTRFLIFVDRSPIYWCIKRHMTVGGITLSYEFVMLKATVKAVEDVRFKLRYFGILMLGGHTNNMYCDNQIMVHNTSLVE